MESIRYLLQVILTVAAFVWELIKAPVAFVCGWIARGLAWYQKIWIRFTHNKYDEFVYKRGVAMGVATLAVIIVIPTLAGLIFQTTYYFATYKKESIYLIQSEEIYPDDNIWAVRGCHTKNCDSDASLYYRITPSLFHHLWNIGHTGNIFLPDTIGSSVPTGMTRCEVVSYGVRAKVMMMLNIYPSILKITCDGYGGLENGAGPIEH